MAVYSGTFAPTRRDGSVVSFSDPIADSRDQLRKAARLPFHASTPNAWQTAFISHVTDARANLRRHIWLATLEDSPLSKAEAAEPRLRPQIEYQRQEHDDLAASVDALIAAAHDPEPVDIWRMIELGEQAILLEMSLARHHNRLSQLLFEATYQDVGGEG